MNRRYIHVRFKQDILVYLLVYAMATPCKQALALMRDLLLTRSGVRHRTGFLVLAIAVALSQQLGLGVGSCKCSRWGVSIHVR